MNRRPVRITIFNHKGGVGKTTLTANIAFALSSLGRSVLLVDSDPQCNLTSYLLSDDVVDDLLNHSSSTRTGGRSGRRSSRSSTTPQSPVSASSWHPTMVGDIALLPGDIRLSEFEEFLGDAWADGFKRRLGGLRATSSISELVSRLHEQRPFDFVFYDTGTEHRTAEQSPSARLRFLHRSRRLRPVFRARSVHAGPDHQEVDHRCQQPSRRLPPTMRLLLRSEPRFLGYIPQRFKMYGQTMTREANSYLRQIRNRMHDDVSSVLRRINEDLAPARSTDPVVGRVKDFTSIVQRAQQEGIAIWECSVRNKKEKDAAKVAFEKIASHIIRRTERNA